MLNAAAAITSQQLVMISEYQLYQTPRRDRDFHKSGTPNPAVSNKIDLTTFF
jgi:hypothetical protein